MSSGEFFLNSEDLELGQRQTGERLHDVELPPWAKSQRDFIRKNAKALESDYVSENLHHWIDLIFGYKQQGEEAVKANNVFYYLTYAGAVKLESARSEHERAALEAQIQEFGQTPLQIFSRSHPCRNDDPYLPLELSSLDIDGRVESAVGSTDLGSDDLQSLVAADKAEILGTDSSDKSVSDAVANKDGASKGDILKSKPVSLFESWTDKTVSFLDRAFGGGLTAKQEKGSKHSGGTESGGSSSSAAGASNLMRISLKSLTDPIDIFSGEITGICYDKDSGSLCFCARDGTSKVKCNLYFFLVVLFAFEENLHFKGHRL